MSDAPLMLGVSGLRGIVGKSLTPEVAMRYAAAFGVWLRSSLELARNPVVVVGRDGRRNGEVFQHAIIAGLTGAGCDVKIVDVATTPTIGVAVGREGADGAMIVTASHNPQEWNGLKCLVTHELKVPNSHQHPASAPTADEAAEIIDAFKVTDPGTTPVRLGSTAQLHDSHQYHCEYVVDCMEWLVGMPMFRKFPSLRVVLDSVNASGVMAGRELLERYLGFAIVHLNSSPSGVFPHPPEPVAENLKDLCNVVVATKADIGFAQDPDADRLAIIDESGRYIGEEYTLALAAWSMMTGPVNSEDVVICTNLSTSRMVDDLAAMHGARVVRTPVGEAHVAQAMLGAIAEVAQRAPANGMPWAPWRYATRHVLGGEGNGGVIWPLVTYVRDSLSAMALVLALMARTGKTVSQLVADIPAYVIEKRKVDLARKEDARPAVERIAQAYRDQRVDLQDGVRIDWDSRKAWLHVRASNTEPIMRLIAEAPTAAEAKRILDEVAKVIG